MRQMMTVMASSLVLGFAACAAPTVDDRPLAVTEPEEMSVEPRPVDLYPELNGFITEVLTELDTISEERRAALGDIAEYVAARTRTGQPSRLTFICTHNSRRSHMSQIWAQTAAHAFGVADVETFSGGTETTAFNPRAVAALIRAGFAIEVPETGDNPVYDVRYGDDMEPMACFSKVYDQPPNPSDGFAAVMTCSAADEACPIVFGADARFAIPYDDPKAFDDTDLEAQKYDERCRQIAREMLYLFSRVGPHSDTESSE